MFNQHLLVFMCKEIQISIDFIQNSLAIPNILSICTYNYVKITNFSTITSSAGFMMSPNVNAATRAAAAPALAPVPPYPPNNQRKIHTKKRSTNNSNNNILFLQITNFGTFNFHYRVIRYENINNNGK